MRKASLSSFGKASFHRDPSLYDNIDDLLKTSKDDDKVKKSFRVPDVVNRLFSDDNHRTVRPRKKSVIPQSRRIREVKRVGATPHNLPGAADYQPNFSAVLTSVPVRSFDRSGLDEPRKKPNLNSCTAAEMMAKWNSQVRGIEFVKEAYVPEEPEPEVIQKKPKKVVGGIAGDAVRDSYIRAEHTPGPSDYTIPLSSAKAKLVIGFGSQASRQEQSGGACEIRDTRQNIDNTKPRAARCVAFAKQSGREPTRKPEDDLWKQIEMEQAKIVESMWGSGNETVKTTTARKREPFALQTRSPKHPFQHIMRKEAPDVDYDVDTCKKALDRPATAFNIRQPACGKDRMVYRKSAAPDVMYNDVNEQYKNTVPRARTAVDIRSEPVRKEPYYYMPHPCGQGDLSEPKSTLKRSGNGAVEMKKMAKRKCVLESPQSKRALPKYPGRMAQTSLL